MVNAAIAKTGQNDFRALHLMDVSRGGIYSDRPYEVVSGGAHFGEMQGRLEGIIREAADEVNNFNHRYPDRKKEEVTMALINSAIAHSRLGYQIEFPLEGYRAWS